MILGMKGAFAEEAAAVAVEAVEVGANPITALLTTFGPIILIAIIVILVVSKWKRK